MGHGLLWWEKNFEEVERQCSDYSYSHASPKVSSLHFFFYFLIDITLKFVVKMIWADCGRCLRARSNWVGGCWLKKTLFREPLQLLRAKHLLRHLGSCSRNIKLILPLQLILALPQYLIVVTVVVNARESLGRLSRGGWRWLQGFRILGWHVAV